MHIPLKSLKILALDCQTTGNNPKSSHLLEIGWLECNATDSLGLEAPTPTTFIIHQPHNRPLSLRIQKLTGIRDDHFEDAAEPLTAMDALIIKAAEVARFNRTPLCPMVIHYARFERGFLNHLHQKRHLTKPMPFDIICTHQIVKRLIPQLPRKGIRAVAGYLGHSMPVTKRCAHHLLATVHIWQHLVLRLATQADVHTMDQLQHWLKHAPVPSVAKSYPMPRKKRLGIADTPGIYRMLRSNGDVLYIGKATSLKKRINSYFHKRRHSEAALEMLTQAVGLKVTPTPTALEAALKESDAIKLDDPPYNSALIKRDRQLFFTSRDFAVQRPKMDQRCVLGPISSTEPFSACHALALHLTTKKRLLLDIPRMMGMSKDYIPDEATFLKGLALFHEKYHSVLDCMNMQQAILHIGRWSWREKQALKATADCLDTESEQSEKRSEFEWTPDGVSGILESLCRRCGFMLRRARWFAILSESTVAWRAERLSQGGLNIIVMHKGDVAKRYQGEPGSSIPDPPGSTATPRMRRGRIDLMRFDRLRVLTTEMRRLIAEDRLECVRLSEKACLYPEQLRQLFNWL